MGFVVVKLWAFVGVSCMDMVLDLHDHRTTRLTGYLTLRRRQQQATQHRRMIRRSDDYPNNGMITGRHSNSNHDDKMIYSSTCNYEALRCCAINPVRK